MSTQKEGGEFELVTSASISVVPADQTNKNMLVSW